MLLKSNFYLMFGVIAAKLNNSLATTKSVIIRVIPLSSNECVWLEHICDVPSSARFRCCLTESRTVLLVLKLLIKRGRLKYK